MKFVTFTATDKAPAPGLLAGDAIYDLRPQGYHSLEQLIAAGPAALKAIKPEGPSVPSANAHLLAPLSAPPRIFCVGLNYLDHAAESKMTPSKVPTIFMKLASGIVGPGATVVLPANSTEVDYEVELAVVIGRSASNVTAENWLDCIFGYTILNDVSARDVQLATSQWTLGKSFPTFCPVGPYIATPDEVGDPHALDIKLTIDGETLQNANTRDFLFNIPAILAYLSSITPLLPGDIVSTGTPPGVGLGRTPKRWLRSGESMTCTIAALGELTNPIR